VKNENIAGTLKLRNLPLPICQTLTWHQIAGMNKAKPDNKTKKNKNEKVQDAERQTDRVLLVKV